MQRWGCFEPYPLNIWPTPWQFSLRVKTHSIYHPSTFQRTTYETFRPSFLACRHSWAFEVVCVLTSPSSTPSFSRWYPGTCGRVRGVSQHRCVHAGKSKLKKNQNIMLRSPTHEFSNHVQLFRRGYLDLVLALNGMMSLNWLQINRLQCHHGLIEGAIGKNFSVKQVKMK